MLLSNRYPKVEGSEVGEWIYDYHEIGTSAAHLYVQERVARPSEGNSGDNGSDYETTSSKTFKVVIQSLYVIMVTNKSFEGVEKEEIGMLCLE